MRVQRTNNRKSNTQWHELGFEPMHALVCVIDWLQGNWFHPCSPAKVSALSAVPSEITPHYGCTGIRYRSDIRLNEGICI